GLDSAAFAHHHGPWRQDPGSQVRWRVGHRQDLYSDLLATLRLPACQLASARRNCARLTAWQPKVWAAQPNMRPAQPLLSGARPSTGWIGARVAVAATCRTLASFRSPELSVLSHEGRKRVWFLLHRGQFHGGLVLTVSAPLSIGVLTVW